MTNPTSTPVRVQLRHSVLAEQAAMHRLDEQRQAGSVFIALAEPPPVGTVLIVNDEASEHRVEVTHVVEVPEADPQGIRGIYGREPSSETLERRGKVGTEHLHPSEEPRDEEPEEEPNLGDTTSDEGGPEDSRTALAVPAPVVEDDSSGGLEIGSDGSDRPEDGGSESHSPGGKRRKGRKRR